MSLQYISSNTFRDFSDTEMLSILEDLSKDQLIVYTESTTAGIYNIWVESHARAVLIAFREELSAKEKEKRESRRWQLKSMGIGYGLGFISGVLLMLLQKFLFG